MSAEGLAVLLVSVLVFLAYGMLYRRKKIEGVEDYISARNRVGGFTLVATLAGSALGAWMLFSPPEAAVTAGAIALIGYAIGSAGAPILFAWLGRRMRALMPEGHTLSEYVLHRYGRAMYALVVLVTVFYMATYVAAEMTAISLASNLIFGIDPLWPAAIIGIGALIYTTARGFIGTVYTDNPQGVVVMALVLALFAWGISNVADLGSFSSAVAERAPQAFDLANVAGIEFALTLIIAIAGAEVLNQSNWQRVFAAESDAKMMRAAGLSALIVVPVMLMVGSFGFLALASGPVENPSVAMFSYLHSSAPQWALYAVLVLVVALVMGTIATLINGLVSLFAVELLRVRPAMQRQKVLWLSRALTVLLSLGAIWVATQGYSVLYIFLVADLVCLACAFPVFYGMFDARCGSRVALLACIAGILAGAAFFPGPDFAGGNMFHAFGAALAVSAAVSVALSMLGRRKFDFGTLKGKAARFD